MIFMSLSSTENPPPFFNNKGWPVSHFIPLRGTLTFTQPNLKKHQKPENHHSFFLKRNKRQGEVGLIAPRAKDEIMPNY